MKCVYLFFTIILLCLFFSLSSAKTNFRKSKTRRQTGPTAFQDIHRNLYPNQWEINPKEKPNRVELDPQDHRIIAPYSEEVTDKLFPRKIYSKDPDVYNLNPANVSDIQKGQMILVSNMTELRKIKGFEDPKPVDNYRHNPVYQKDPYAYYDPVQNAENIKTFHPNNIFMVPIDVKQNATEERDRELAIKRSLMKNDKYYYDPTHNFTIEVETPQEKYLAEAAKRRAEGPRVLYHEYLKAEKVKDEAVKTILGKKKKIIFRDNPHTHMLVQKEKVRVEALAMGDEVKLLNKKDATPYYNGSGK